MAARQFREQRGCPRPAVIRGMVTLDYRRGFVVGHAREPMELWWRRSGSNRTAALVCRTCRGRTCRPHEMTTPAVVAGVCRLGGGLGVCVEPSCSVTVANAETPLGQARYRRACPIRDHASKCGEAYVEELGYLAQGSYAVTAGKRLIRHFGSPPLVLRSRDGSGIMTLQRHSNSPLRVSVSVFSAPTRGRCGVSFDALLGQGSLACTTLRPHIHQDVWLIGSARSRHPKGLSSTLCVHKRSVQALASLNRNAPVSLVAGLPCLGEWFCIQQRSLRLGKARVRAIAAIRPNRWECCRGRREPRSARSFPL
jgi:hypothetical protein